MRKMMLTILLAEMVLSAFAKVHKFSPEFQAVYDAASTPEVQEAQRKGAEAKVVYRVVDDEGNLVSAHYGKIYGLWEFSTMMRVKDVFFNPTPNDTNLESK